MYCQHCGNSIETDPAAAAAEAAAETADGAADVAAEISTAEVEIARIQADRDVTLAKIERGIIGQEIEATTAEDAVKAELLDEMLAPPPEPEPEPVPVVIDDPEPEPDGAPPEMEGTPEPAGAKRASNPWWG